MYQLDQYTVSLLHFEDGFQDETGRVWTANGGATTSTAGAPIESTSAYFNGTAATNISTPATSDLQFGDDIFTIDFWMFPISTDVQQHPIGMIPGWRINGGWMIYLNNDGSLGFYRGVSEFDDLVETSFGAVRLNSWSHVAVVKEAVSSTKIKIYVNGVKKAEGNLSSGTILDTSVDLRIGRGHETWNSARPFKGYIDEVRISKSIARWTEDFMVSGLPDADDFLKHRKNECDSEQHLIKVKNNFYLPNNEWLLSNGAFLSTEVITCDIKDLQTTIDSLPRYLNHDVVINVKPGTYNEAITIKRFSGPGKINIFGAESLVNSTNYNIGSLTLSCCTNSLIEIQGFNITSANGSAVYANDCPVSIALIYCSMSGGDKTTSGNIGLVASTVGGGVSLSYCAISNKYYAVFSSRSIVRVSTLSGSNNNILYFTPYGGTIHRMNAGTITGATINKCGEGGLIINPSGGTIGS